MVILLSLFFFVLGNVEKIEKRYKYICIYIYMCACIYTTFLNIIPIEEDRFGIRKFQNSFLSFEEISWRIVELSTSTRKSLSTKLEVTFACSRDRDPRRVHVK